MVASEIAVLAASTLIPSASASSVVFLRTVMLTALAAFRAAFRFAVAVSISPSSTEVSLAFASDSASAKAPARAVDVVVALKASAASIAVLRAFRYSSRPMLLPM